MSKITQNAQLRRDVRFMVHPAPHEISAAHGAIVTEGQMLHDPQEKYPSQTICRMASCNGKSGEVAARIVTLLNSYGLVPNDLGLAVAVGQYQVWVWDEDYEWVRDGAEPDCLAEARSRAARLREAGHRVQVRMFAIIEEK